MTVKSESLEVRNLNTETSKIKIRLTYRQTHNHPKPLQTTDSKLTHN